MEELLTGLPDKVIAGVEPEYTITLEERDTERKIMLKTFILMEYSQRKVEKRRDMTPEEMLGLG